MSNDTSSDIYESLDLFQIGAVVWNHKWTVIVVTAIFVALASAYAFTAKQRFRAEVLLRPADTKSTPGVSSALGGLGGLASLAGINIGIGNTAEPIAVLSSREFTAAFLEDQNLLPVLFPSRWDSTNKQWKPSRFSALPDVRDGVRYFDKTIRTVREDKKTGFVTMSIEWTDPNIAASWANLLVDRVNERMRNRALAESELNVAYLKQELASSNIVSLQQSIGHVLETELQKLMLAKATKEYSFKIIDHAEPPKWRSSPRRGLIVGAAFLLGFGSSAFFIVARYAKRQSGKMSGTGHSGSVT
jgi:LPS O-antigen subunit length determinant protein (WzzB/FepE family)